MSIFNKKGKVFLVGAGPGDPELVTLKALKVLKTCEVLIFDSLVNKDLLNFTSTNVEKIFVGFSRHKDRLKQEKINCLMIGKALSGKVVVRLKGGDSFIFGRGGEEAMALEKAGIDWEIIPGLSAGFAVPAYAGIPLTYRGISSSVAFVTGHQCLDKNTVEWKKLVRAVDTIVIFMGAARIIDIAKELLSAGCSAITPIGLIESGTNTDQRIRIACIGNIHKMIKKDSVRTPALIVIGEVVKFHQKLFDRHPHQNHVEQKPTEVTYELLSDIY